MKFQSIADVIDQRINELELEVKEPEKYRPIKTNIDLLDEKIIGVKTKMYISIIGKAKRGKSSLAQHIAAVLSTAKRGQVDYYLLEEIASQLGIRILVRSTARVDRNKIYALDLTPEDFVDMREAAAMIREDMNFFVVDDLFDISKMIEQTVARKSAFQVIDYAQLLSERGENESIRLTNISRKLIQARNVDGVGSIVVWQENEEGGILGSNSGLRDSDLLIRVNQPKDKDGNVMDGMIEIEVLPSRQVKSVGKFLVPFDGSHNRIYNKPAILNLEDMLIEGLDHDTQTPEPEFEAIDAFSE